MTSSDAILLWAGGHNMDMDNDFIMLAVQDGLVQVGCHFLISYFRFPASAWHTLIKQSYLVWKFWQQETSGLGTIS